jgi:AcrR family transcriptional regulator
MEALVSRSSDRILSKALELFARKGYEATSVREICEAAEITKPTLYHFFGSKEGVYRAIVDGALHDFRQSVESIMGGPGAPADKLHRFARAPFERVRENEELFRFLVALAHNPASAAPRTDFPTFYEGIVALVASVVEKGVREGTFGPGPTDVRMIVLMGALSEAMCGWAICGKPELTSDLAGRIVDTVVAGWKPTVH